MQATGSTCLVWSRIHSQPNRQETSDSDANTAWIDLNDKHFVHGLSGWVLKSAEAINNSRPSGSGHIVGTGLLNGSPRAFVLVPNSVP